MFLNKPTLLQKYLTVCMSKVNKINRKVQDFINGAISSLFKLLNMIMGLDY